MANVENMILTSPRYTELFNKFERLKERMILHSLIMVKLLILKFISISLDRQLYKR